MHIIKKNNQQLKENERIIGENFHVHKWSLPLSIIYIYICLTCLRAEIIIQNIKDTNEQSIARITKLTLKW